ncbi:MAG: tRNA (guanosine(37)-N1)-methyltransferase TrmD [Deltaproteobacteria bacterium]|nr:tRNA (guanosine(37)-N1)-methyltransferase TrmD [Deltaproteobacteria bacterium]
MRFDVLSIFPDFFKSPLSQTILKRAIEKGLISVNINNIRDYASGRHKSTDDYPYGGGKGMIMMAEPIISAVEDIRSKIESKASLKIILTTPQGKLLEQGIVRKLAGFKNIIIICGRYEGIDERVRTILNPEEISIGDYVLSGGELPAIVIIDAVSRNIPGVVGSEVSVETDTFSGGLLKYPQWTRPEEFMGLRVPSVLLSGNHKEIERWRRQETIKKTLEKRPDLLEKAEVSEDDKIIISELKKQ